MELVVKNSKLSDNKIDLVNRDHLITIIFYYTINSISYVMKLVLFIIILL
jgi:hypothetical protein